MSDEHSGSRGTSASPTDDPETTAEERVEGHFRPEGKRSITKRCYPGRT